MSATLLGAIFLLPALLLLSTSISMYPFNTFSKVLKNIQLALLINLVNSIVGIVWLVKFGPTEINFFEFYELGLSVRLDPLSLIMYFMISIIAFVVIRFSRNYLDGDPRIKEFFSRLAFTIAFVQVLVLSGNIAIFFIAWVGTSIGLHQLLRFYPDRKRALLASRKKFLIARLGDLMLLMAFTLIYLEFHNGNLGYLFDQFQEVDGNSIPIKLQIAAVFLVLSAALKSVQVPFHGWLLDVMEAPTPVSALLHAGLLNAGPFLIIRFAFLLDIAENASILLITIGAFSALFGAIVATTQPALKTSLAYSSVGHMGFTLMLCGFGAYSAALLHLIAHSFYKAHAFLSSGSIIDKVQTKNAVDYARLGKIWRMILGLVTTVILYISTAYFWGTTVHTEFQLLVIGSIIFFGVLSIQINAFDSNISAQSIISLLIGSGIVINLFFIFEKTVNYTINSQIPEIREPSSNLVLMSIAILVAFFIPVFIQFSNSKIRNWKFSKHIGIHIRNGLYFNLIFDKMMNSLSTKTVK